MNELHYKYAPALAQYPHPAGNAEGEKMADGPKVWSLKTPISSLLRAHLTG